MGELAQLNIHSSRDIIARHGLTLPELFQLSLEFYKEEKHQFNLSYEQKNQLAAYWRQCMLGPYHPDKLNPGYFDFVGNDRKKAWEALGEISSNGAMAGFCNLLETVCPDLVPWIRHKKRERENKMKDEKEKEAAIVKQQEEEEKEASKLINIVKKAEELQKTLSVQEDSSEEEEDMPTLEKNDRCPSATENAPPANQITVLQSRDPLPIACEDSAKPQPTVCPQLKLPQHEPETISTAENKTDPNRAVDSNCTDEKIDSNCVDNQSNPAVDSNIANHASNHVESGPTDLLISQDSTPAAVNSILAQHFACVMYLRQLKEAGHVLTPEQEVYLTQMLVYEEQLKAHNGGEAQSNGEPSDLKVKETTQSSEIEDKTESQESFSLVNESEGSLVIIKSAEVIDEAPEDGPVEVASSTSNPAPVRSDGAEHHKKEALTNGDMLSGEALTNGDEGGTVVPQDVPTSRDVPVSSQDVQISVTTHDSGVPANADDVSALAETLQNQLGDEPHNDGARSDNSDSDSEVKLWSKTGVDMFIGEVSKDPDSILHVGRGETVTVRIPTYESGSALYWEFATEHYDIGFGASFEWEDEEKRVRREPILPILRRTSQEKVITGSHAYPRSGTYLLLFDNSYSLLRSKTVYYRVFYTR